MASLATSRLVAAEEPASPAAPAELAAVLQRHRERREALLKPLRERLMRDVDAAVNRLVSARRTADALALQRFVDEIRRTGDVPNLPADAPVDLVSLFTNYTVARDNLLRPLQQSLEQELKNLQAAFIRRGDLAAAAAVEAELERLKPPPLRPDPIDWEKERRQVRYQYEHERFFRGTFDYSDRQRRKLTDGVTGQIPTEGTVGWSQVPPPRIRVEFARPVLPQALNLYMFGGGQWNMAVSREIRVLAGEQLPMANLIGQSNRHDDRTGWVRIPLKPARPERVYWIELAPSATGYVLLDEMSWE